MFGIELYEILLILKQVGLAATGAASFWGIVFLLMRQQTPAQKLLWIFFPAFFVFFSAWTALALSSCVFCAEAHEGIYIAQNFGVLKYAMREQFFVFSTLALWGLAALLTIIVRRRILEKSINLHYFYGVSFIFISALLLYPWGETETLRHSLFTSLHAWHSVLTLGTVIVVDFIFATLKRTHESFLKKVFPLLSKAILLGLGIDFLSVGLIFNEAFAITPKLLFTQTLVGIIIINGVLLSGPIMRAAFASQKPLKVASFSGSISIVGWFSITALDGFRHLSLGYFELFLVYFAFVALAYSAHRIIENSFFADLWHKNLSE